MKVSYWRSLRKVDAETNSRTTYANFSAVECFMRSITGTKSKHSKGQTNHCHFCFGALFNLGFYQLTSMLLSVNSGPNHHNQLYQQIGGRPKFHRAKCVAIIWYSPSQKFIDTDTVHKKGSVAAGFWISFWYHSDYVDKMNRPESKSSQRYLRTIFDKLSSLSCFRRFKSWRSPQWVSAIIKVNSLLGYFNRSSVGISLIKGPKWCIFQTQSK